MTTATTPTKKQRHDRARSERIAREEAAVAAAGRRRRLIRLGAALGAAALVVAILIAVSMSGSGGGKSAATTPAASSATVAGAKESAAMLAGVPQRGVTLGNPKAPVRVVEFADLQCPFCKDFAVQDLPRIVQDYVRPGKVRMDFRTLAFIGPDSERSARVAEAAAQQNRLWNVVDLAFWNQGGENSGFATDTFLRNIVGAVPGLDPARVFAGRGSASVDAQLKAADTLATQSGISSTPTFLVGRGTNLKTVDSAGLTAAIKAALAR
jgi:protein-disulfide isomerase